MRKNFVFYALIPAVVLILVLYLFLDGWIESGLEYGGEKTVGAKVEIDGLHLSLSPIGVEFKRLQVANPRDTWKNIFETGTVRFALNFGQLLRGKFIIETMEVNNLILATKRSTDGVVPQEPKKSEPAAPPASTSVATPSAAVPASEAPSSISEAAKPAAEQKESKTPSFDMDRIKRELNIDSLLNVGNLQSLQELDTLKLQIETASQQWDSSLADLDKSKQRLSEIESTVKSINVGEIKSLDAAKSALEKVTTTYKSTTELVSTFNTQKSALTEQVNTLSGSVGKIDDIARKDFQFVVSLAHLPDVNMRGLAELVLGKDILRQAFDYLYWLDFARAKVPQYTSMPDPTNPGRMRGINIHFPSERGYPKFWIRKILVSGGTDAAQDPNFFYAKGEILDVSNDQRITGKPIVVDLEAKQGRGTRAEISASFDRRSEPGLDTYGITVSGVPIASLETGRSDFLPSRITNAVGGASIDIRVPGNQFEGNIAAVLSGMKMNFTRDPKNVVERIVRDVLQSIDAVHMKIRMWKNAETFDVAFETDLDDLIASRTKKVIGEEVARLQNEIRNKVNAKIAAKRAEVEKLLSVKKEEVNRRLADYQNQLNEKTALVEAKKKELEKRIDDEKNRATEEAKKKAGDALKKLIPKKF